MREIEIAFIDDIPVNGMRQFEIDGSFILICRSGKDVYAVNGVCPHRGAQLAQGELDGTTVVCPWHDWAFDITDGCGLTNPNSCLECYTVSTRDGKIVVALPEA